MPCQVLRMNPQCKLYEHSRQEYDGKKVDIWAIGCVMFGMFAGTKAHLQPHLSAMALCCICPAL